MPLSKVRSKARANISKVMAEYESTGMIGNYKPPNKRKAREMAVAIAIDITSRAKSRK